MSPTDDAPLRRVLEVRGAGDGAAGRVECRVADAAAPPRAARNVDPATAYASALRLPYADAAFDEVVCIDTLERLPGPERPAALRELARVARERLIVRVAAGTFATAADHACAQHLQQADGARPTGLDVRMKLGLPTLGDLVAIPVLDGRSLSIHVDEGVLAHCSAVLPHGAPFVARLRALLAAKCPPESGIALADADAPYAYRLVIDTAARRQVARSAVAAGVPAAAPAGAAPAHSRFALFAVGHRTDRMPAIPGIRRILACARDRRSSVDADILRGDAGISIADRNAGWSEMTAIHWVWRNVADVDAVGFCHYRRYFDFRPPTAARERETRLRTAQELRAVQAHFAVPEALRADVRRGAIVVTRPTDLKFTNPEHYMAFHLPGHYLAMANWILAHHPHLAPHVAAQLRDSHLVANNMFVMPWADFDRLCRFWFDCLFALDDAIPVKPGGYQQRVIAFLSERVFDIHVRWLRDQDRRVVEFPIFSLEDTAFAGAR